MLQIIYHQFSFKKITANDIFFILLIIHPTATKDKILFQILLHYYSCILILMFFLHFPLPLFLSLIKLNQKLNTNKKEKNHLWYSKT